MTHASRTAAAMERENAQPDLFVQAQIDAARELVRLCEDARDLADRKCRCAPRGSVKARLMAFSKATHELLRAEGALAKLLREVGQ